MKIIAHRGLTNGPNGFLENHPEQIISCIQMGLDAEIDVWFFKEQWYLGHDEPQHCTDVTFLSNPGLWIHAKNIEACNELTKYHALNYFWHESDARVLTSHGFWWTNPRQYLCNKSIAVLPELELSHDNLRESLQWKCVGICTDWTDKLV